ncbi:DUF2318 domain-containing protein [Schaalia sp. 19OD2882]|uniref:DUF2318 domain-containing protein n=1 Tax=Schaalia sp. 19OD2882 TaxID=2794089 RepID=UPI001C1EC3CD|nr:DUF2318 domain-containing protein [Schaalia sp. 19OD2882]QWW19842.1 DUF2318 domain-containing protein [Schaalia sp. 19OD2882]
MIEQMGQIALVVLLTALAAGTVIPLIPVRGKGRGATAVRRWVIGGGICLGVVASLALTVVNTVLPKAVNRQVVALWTLPVAIVLVIAFIALTLLRRRAEADSVALDTATQVVGGAYLAAIVFRAAPTAMAPAVLLTSGTNELLSTQALLTFVGYGLGWGVAVLLGFFAWRLTTQARTMWPMVVVTAVLALTHVLLIVRILQAKRIITMSNSAFTALSWTINHEAIFPVCAMGALGVVAFLLWRSGRTEPVEGENPAQRRLRRAQARMRKFIAGTAVGGYLCGALLVTVGVAIASAEVELSAPEPFTVVDGKAVVDVKDISDGHLHRFAHTTSSGVEVRFIVIQKAGSSFGVGLDACEICGASGYYEKDGKIICKLCEVAMNIATIGFKGGCNPIPIEYEVSNGTLTVPLSVLEANASIFA